MLSPIASAACQALAASVAEFITYPIAVVRTREQAHIASPKVVVTFNGIFATMKNLYKSDGLKALYRGVWSSVLVSSFSWGSFRFIYEKLDPITFSPTEFNNCMTKSVISSFITASIIHPFWIARLSLQLESFQAKRAGWLLSGNVIRWVYHTFSTNGFRGIYKGYFASFASIPQITIQMSVYESLKNKNPVENSQKLSFLNSYLPIFYGLLSRLCGSMCVYPIMVSRAQMQCQLSPEFQCGIFKNIVSTYKIKKIGGLYVGFRYQIMRSLLYGLIFYSFYEAFTKIALNLNRS